MIIKFLTDLDKLVSIFLSNLSNKMTSLTDHMHFSSNTRRLTNEFGNVKYSKSNWVPSEARAKSICPKNFSQHFVLSASPNFATTFQHPRNFCKNASSF